MSAVLTGGRVAWSREVAGLAEQVGLPFGSRVWRGSSGSWAGFNHGNSIDFQDHRSYMPGDDPRHLDWAVYARTNHYTMKLFREEVTPRLDAVLDASRSMSLTPEKEARSLALLALVLSAALRDNISVCVYAAHSTGRFRRLEVQSALALASLPEFGAATAATVRLPLMEIPWRAGSLRVLVSDLLLPQAPERELAGIGREQGRAIVLAPFLRAESDPDWDGNLELHDCETPLVCQQRVEPFLLSRYRDSYRRHFELWEEAARRQHVPFARISCELPLGAAVRLQALPAGVFEARH